MDGGKSVGSNKKDISLQWKKNQECSCQMFFKGVKICIIESSFRDLDKQHKCDAVCPVWPRFFSTFFYPIQNGIAAKKA